jgi:hypothetical protein
MTYPAPEILQDDPWFGPAPWTEKSIALKEAREFAEVDNQILPEDAEPQPKEPEDIHEVLYKIATQNNNTTLALDPMPTPGGSENFQGGWMSGAGIHHYS